MSSSTSGQKCTAIKQSSGFRTAEFTVIKNRDEHLWWEEHERSFSHIVTHKMTLVRPTENLVWRNKADQHSRERIGSIGRQYMNKFTHGCRKKREGEQEIKFSKT